MAATQAGRREGILEDASPPLVDNEERHREGHEEHRQEHRQEHHLERHDGAATQDTATCRICFNPAENHRSCPTCTSAYCLACLSAWYAAKQTACPSCPSVRNQGGPGVRCVCVGW